MSEENHVYKLGGFLALAIGILYLLLGVKNQRMLNLFNIFYFFEEKKHDRVEKNKRHRRF